MRILSIVMLLFIVTTTGPAPTAQNVYTARDTGVTPPKAVKMVTPKYTESAAGAHLEGTVTMEAVINADGTVGEVKVTESLDSSLNGLDDQAVIALRQSEFEAGTKDGKPVAVRVTVRTVFSLR